MKADRRTDPVVVAALFLLIFLVPLAWTKLFVAEYTLAKLLALNGALLLAAWASAANPSALASGIVSLDAPLAAMLVVAALSAAGSDDPATSLIGRYDSYAYGLWGLALTAATFQLAARGVRGREADPARWLTWSAAIIGAYAVVQWLGLDPIVPLSKLPTGRRAVSSLGSPVDLGAFLAVLWPAALWRLDTERSSSSAALAVLTGAGLAASGARGGMLAAAVGTAAYCLLSRGEPAAALRRSLAAAGATAAAALLWAFRSGAGPSDVGRREVWKTAWEMFLQRPWLGWGPDGFEDAFKFVRTDAFVAAAGSTHYQAYAHNDILHVLAGLGLAGAAAYAWLFAAQYGAALRALAPAKSRALAAALTAGLLALWVNLEFNPVALEVWALAAVSAGLLASLTAPAQTSAPPRAPLLAAAALLTASLFVAAGMARADAAFKRGVKAHNAGDFARARLLIASARRARPCELSYMMGEVNTVVDWINADRGVKARLELLALAETDARQAVFCHPRQSGAHYIAGNVARMHFDLGFKDRLADALRAYDAALALDPKFEPLLDARRQAGQLSLSSSR